MTTTLRKPLAPGECRIRLTGYQQPVLQHLVKIAGENPHAFGGVNDNGNETWTYRQLGRSLTQRLQHRDIVLTKVQREFIHTILDAALRDPEPFGGGKAEWFHSTVLDIREKLPKRGAGTYN